MTRPSPLLGLVLSALFACSDEAPAQGTLHTVAGNGVAGLGVEGLPVASEPLYLPQDVAFDPDGRLYIVDWNNHRIVRRSRIGTLEVVAGSGMLGEGLDGPAREVDFNHPTHVLFDGEGGMVIAAWHNSKVKRLDLATGTITNLAGTGARSFSGEGEPANRAALDLPVATALDAKGNLFVADQANLRIRVIDSTGVLLTAAGTGELGYSGDGGPASLATFRGTSGQAAEPGGRIVFDREGNLFFADSMNHAIRRISADGVVTTVLGNGEAGSSPSGTGAAEARLNNPTDVEVAADGTLYVADKGNSCIRALGADGVVRTVAGRCGERGFDGDGKPAAETLLDRPFGIALGPDGALYIADSHNHRIRRIVP